MAFLKRLSKKISGAGLGEFLLVLTLVAVVLFGCVRAVQISNAV